MDITRLGIVMQTLPSESGRNFTTGLDQLFVFIAQEEPLFFPLMLFALYIIIMMSGAMAQGRREGQSDWPQWAAVSGFLVAIVATFMGFIDGLITVATLVLTYAVAILSGIWFFYSQDRR